MDQYVLFIAIVDGYLFMVIVMWIFDYKVFDTASGKFRPNFGSHEGTCLFRILLEAVLAPILLFVLMPCIYLCDCFLSFHQRSSKNEEET